MDRHFDIVIVGAGMAGASLAAALAARAPQVSICVLEAEDRPGYHATGRSAAFWTESYGGPGVQPLTTASGPVLRDLGVLTSRSALTIAREAQREDLRSFAATFREAGVSVEWLEREALAAIVPGLAADWTCGAREPSCCDIDVASLHQHYLAAARASGVTFRNRAALLRAHRADSRWSLSVTGDAALTCGTLVDAAGAWADPVARAANVAPLGIAPFRRTVAQIETSPAPPADLPLVLDVSERFYFKPESGRLWLSPHDETPSPPCDAAAEEIDVATAIARFEGVTDWAVRRVEHRWAGLRSFAPDRLPVYGHDPDEPAFFWFAGQGGFGIQTAPAAAELGARLLLCEEPGAVDPAPYCPSRFR